MTPYDDFTPHGYLDNPYHSWKLNPSGVLRSLPPLGMGWHVPNLGSYVNNQFQYTAHLTFGLRIGKTVLVTPEDFRRQGCTIVSHLHTKNRFEYTCEIPQHRLTLTIRYFLVQENALGCILSFKSTAPQTQPVTCYLIHCHTHNPHTSRLWEHGLYALQEAGTSYAMLGLASEGDVFVHGVQAADGDLLEIGSMGYTISLEDMGRWAAGKKVEQPHITQRQENGWQVRTVALPFALTLEGNQERIINAVLARGLSRDQATQQWEDGMEEIALVETEHRADDEQFWEGAPQLSGDWPEYWKRGLVYDFETLRMVMRPPVGFIPHVWDAMQIQAPRTVLAEAAMDALFLSYADPDLAGEVILGHFESAPHPNLPCMREDGSFNMIADDGQICGTAPEWGYPLWCCQQLWLRSGNLSWLKRLYPGAAAYVRWWLEHRRDGEGWEIYGCSWESGQDVSTRFGPQQTGGTIIQHLRPVDLQASIAQGATILAQWATLLAEADSPENDAYQVEVGRWQAVADEFTTKTRQMWQQGWFRDYDSVARIWSSEQDAMHLSPIFCGVATQEQIEQLRPALAQPPSNNPYWRPLSWPPIIMTVTEAARSTVMLSEAAELAYRFVDASYRSIDSRELDEYGNIPGVTRENRREVVSGKWGQTDYVNSGIEGYGWGAVSIHLLIRHLLGLYATDPNSITLAPTLPKALRRPGATYTIAPIPWGKYVLSLTCKVKNAHGYEAILHLRPRLQESQSETIGEQEHHWEGTWGEERTFPLDR